MGGLTYDKKIMWNIVLGAFLLFIACETSQGQSATNQYDIPNEEELINVAREAAAMFYYYPEINSRANNLVVGPSEVGGQCGDYALAFVNIWNERHPEQKALLVVQQQNLTRFPDGLYDVIGIDDRIMSLDFKKNGRQVSGFYSWNGIIGYHHPEVGNYLIRLVRELHIKSHFNISNWEKNGPHVWVMVGDISVDPTYTDIWTNRPTIGKDEW